MTAVLWTSAVLVTINQSSADIITQWNFNSVAPDNKPSTGTTMPYIGSGAASLVGGTTESFGSGSIGDTADDDSSWVTTTYAPPFTGNLTRGVQFAVDTRGYKDIVLSWEQNISSTASKYNQFRYSVDGGDHFFNFKTPDDNGPFDHSFAGVWNSYSVDLTGISGVNNNANLVLQFLAVFAPGTNNYVSPNTEIGDYASSGQWRFDMVTVQGTVPEPGTLALLGTGFAAMIGLSVVRARRRSASKPEA
jgi:hypothetical protein